MKAAAILEKGSYKVKKNIRKAEELYSKAAKLNNSEAYIKLTELT